VPEGRTLHIERVEVGSSQVEATVRVRPEFASTADVEDVATRALELFPGLVRHTCVSGSAHGIVAEIAATETAHLLEHVAAECMALSGSPRDLRAETSWDFARDGAYVYHVRLSYDVDLVALGALQAAVGIVDWLMGVTAERPDTEAIITKLTRVRAEQ
jgi:hypothetical protein